MRVIGSAVASNRNRSVACTVTGSLPLLRRQTGRVWLKPVNGNIRAPLRGGPGYRDMHDLLLKALRLAATKTEFVAF
jgi:hypothetical protein